MTPHILFYDTETTGFPKFNAPYDSEEQPHVMQLAAKLVNGVTRECVYQMKLHAIQGEWEISQGAIETHGITKDHANMVGWPEDEVIGRFFDLWRRASLRVAHNETFDEFIIRVGLYRYFDSESVNFSDKWRAGEAFCTMHATTDICQLPSPRGNGYKWPKLTEAYKFFFGKEFEGAHDAMADVEACEAIYWHLLDEKAKDATKNLFA